MGSFEEIMTPPVHYRMHKGHSPKLSRRTGEKGAGR